MPSKREPRKRGDRQIEAALRALEDALDSSGVGWAVIGGIAVIAHGVRRMTTDVDAAVVAGELSERALLGILARHEIVARTDDAEEFAKANLVLLVTHQPTGVEIDISFAWTEFERRAIAASVATPFGRTRPPMALPADLLVYKAIAGRPRDLEDATSLLLMHPHIDVESVRAQVVELAALAEAPELVNGLDAAIATARGSSPRRQ